MFNIIWNWKLNKATLATINKDIIDNKDIRNVYTKSEPQNNYWIQMVGLLHLYFKFILMISRYTEWCYFHSMSKTITFMFE